MSVGWEEGVAGMGGGGVIRSVSKLSGWDLEQKERSAEKEVPHKAAVVCKGTDAFSSKSQMSHESGFNKRALLITCKVPSVGHMIYDGSARTRSRFRAIKIQVTPNVHSWHGNQKARGTQFSKFILQLFLHYVWVWMLIVMLRPMQVQKHIS